MNIPGPANVLAKLIVALAIMAAGLLLLLVWRNNGFDHSGNVILALLLIALVFNWLAARLFRRLENNHPAKYREMGGPRMFQPFSLRNYWSSMRFLFTAEHKTLNDVTVSRLVITMRILWIATFGVMVIVVAAERFFGLDARTHNYAVSGNPSQNPLRASFADTRAAGFVVSSIEMLSEIPGLHTRNLLLNDTLPLIVEGDISLENVRIIYEQSTNNRIRKPPISSIRGSDTQAEVWAPARNYGVRETYYRKDDGSWSQNTPDASDRSTGIWGIVRNDNEERLANVLVGISIESPPGRGACATTDTNGEFFVSLPPGRYEISAGAATEIPGYIVMGHSDYGGSCHHQVRPQQKTGPIYITYTRPVTVTGIREEEVLTTDRQISWSCSYNNVQYRLELNQVPDTGGCEFPMGAAVEVGGRWSTQTSLVIPVSQLNPGWHELYIWARDPVTRKNVSMMNGFLHFLVERPAQ